MGTLKDLFKREETFSFQRRKYVVKLLTINDVLAVCKPIKGRYKTGKTFRYKKREPTEYEKTVRITAIIESKLFDNKKRLVKNPPLKLLLKAAEVSGGEVSYDKRR